MTVRLFVVVYLSLCLILTADYLIHHYLMDSAESFTFLDIKVIGWAFSPAVLLVMIHWTCCRIVEAIRG